MNEEINVNELKFGDYVLIELLTYSDENQFYTHKVINTYISNVYVDVPIKTPAEETFHRESVPVVSCICCGVSETVVKKYKISDVRKVLNHDN